MSAIGEIPHHCRPCCRSSRRKYVLMETGGNRLPPASLSLAIDTLQLPFGNRDRALGIVASGAEVGEHVDHQEVGDRGRGLLPGSADAGGRKRALASLAEHRVLRISGPHR